MGVRLFDQYSLLHFAVGVVVYFWKIKFVPWLIIHTVFEIIDNTKSRIKYNKYIKPWPGGKLYRDFIVNSVGDTVAAVLGWLCAYYLDKLGKKLHWYPNSVTFYPDSTYKANYEEEKKI